MVKLIDQFKLNTNKYKCAINDDDDDDDDIEIKCMR